MSGFSIFDLAFVICYCLRLRAATASCNLDSVETKQLVLFAWGRYNLEYNLVKFAMTAIER